MLVDAKGMALYTYDKDATGVSNCTGQCAQNWPPLLAEAGAKAEGEWSADSTPFGHSAHADPDTCSTLIRTGSRSAATQGWHC